MLKFKTTITHTLGHSLSLGFSLGLLAIAPPATAEETNFGSRSLAPGFAAEAASLSGFTGGSYSFSALSNRDRDGNACLGYGDARPDYILTLEQDFSRLSFSVDSGGADTTLLIRGPGGVWCGNDISKLDLDAQIQGQDLKAGSYSVWVGTMVAGDRQSYRLTLSEDITPQPSQRPSNENRTPRTTEIGPR